MSNTFQTQAAPVSAASADAQRPEEIDWEERRWQMEWDRRNVED